MKTREQPQHREGRPAGALTPNTYSTRPCVRTRWPFLDGRIRWIPVLGPAHSDREIIGFDPHHFHVDYRFLPARLRAKLEEDASTCGVQPVYQIPIHWVEPEGHVGLVELESALKSRIPRETWYRPIRLMFKANYPPYPQSRARWLEELPQAHAGEQLQGEDRICPHKGAALQGITPDPDGYLTCPLHGLRFDASTGEVLAEGNWPIHDMRNRQPPKGEGDKEPMSPQEDQDRRPMTDEQWKDGHYGIVWSIHRHPEDDPGNQSNSQAQDHPDPEEVLELELRAPEGMPDGTYDAVVKYLSLEGRAEGVTISKGQFLPGPTARAVLQAVCRCFGADEQAALDGDHVADHIFVERHEWKPDQNAIQFYMGS